MEYASKATAGTALGFGIGGAALALLQNGGLGGIMGGNACGDDKLVTRYENSLTTENAILKAQADVDSKLLNVYNTINNQINTLNSKVDSNAASQAVINCGFNSSIGILQTQVEALSGMTKLVIPNSSVCPGWGTATVSVSTGTTTA